ncbi:hypothetical protein EC988_001503 [Linderina pennispora]|nr:hypothetical protein EC988_001503 [Linderina pennispora]
MTWSGEKNAAKSFTVPYTGFNGNYRQVDVLSQPSEGLPILTDTKGTPIEGTKFSVTDTTPAVVNFRLEVPSRIVKVTLVDKKNTSLGYVTGGYLEYVPRNLQAAETYLYTALVTKRVFKDELGTKPANVTAGQYKVRLDALRPLGNPKSQKDFQTWISPVFTVA